MHSRLVLALTLSSLIGLPNANAAPLAMEAVRSFAYVIAPMGESLEATVKSALDSKFDLVILGNYPLEAGKPLPAHEGKLIIGYIDIGESTDLVTRKYFNGSPQPWFGAPTPGFQNLYTVQYWNPSWLPVVLSQLDEQIAAGFDGTFIDVLTGFERWLPGNGIGNPPFPSSAAHMTNLLKDIRAHLRARQLTRPFYLIGNNPEALERAAPGALSQLDAVFNEATTYTQSSADATIAVPNPHFRDSNDLQAAAELFKGRTVLGNDYSPQSDPEATLRSFEIYLDHGWIPSVTTALQSPRILKAGPMLFSATDRNPNVVGDPDRVNFISGGTAKTALLQGGNQGDYLIGGAGRNLIRGGSGNDTIYAHPRDIPFANRLVARVGADVKSSSTPSLQIVINGQLAFGPSTVPTLPSTQTISIDTTRFGQVTDIRFIGEVPPYVDASRYANIQIQKLSFQGRPMSFLQASFPIGSHHLNGGEGAILNAGGSAIFGMPTLPVSPPAFPDTSGEIDGGGGHNTVVYRGPRSNYIAQARTDGSLSISSKASAEGPHVVRNVQRIVFSDSQIDMTQMSNQLSDCLFNWAERNYPQLFAPRSKSAVQTPYYYRHYTSSNSYLGVSAFDGRLYYLSNGSLWDLGPAAGWSFSASCQ